MSLAPVLGDVALPVAARGSGTFTSGPVANAGLSGHVVGFVHCTAATGTSPTLDVSLEESDDGESWSAVTGSAAPQLTAEGHRVIGASASKKLIRVTSTVGGTTPSVTYSVAVLALP